MKKKILHNYFNIHTIQHYFVTASCHVPLSIPAVVSQNVTNKYCLVCAKSEKYTFFVNPQMIFSVFDSDTLLPPPCLIFYLNMSKFQEPPSTKFRYKLRTSPRYCNI